MSVFDGAQIGAAKLTEQSKVVGDLIHGVAEFNLNNLEGKKLYANRLMWEIGVARAVGKLVAHKAYNEGESKKSIKTDIKEISSVIEEVAMAEYATLKTKGKG